MLSAIHKAASSFTRDSLFSIVVVASAFVGTASDRGCLAATPENARPGVKYVGSDKCVECHQDQHRSYLETTHSVAAERTNAANEPAAASFRHEYSGNTYEVERQGDRLIHREIIPGSGGEPRNITEEEIYFSIGSGAHGKSYLYRDGDFWAQSPLTWFRETEEWGMSPGYDRPTHLSFRRKVRTGCVFCHVGSIDRKEGNPFCFEIVEETIGCERCHGPGELHVQKYHENPDSKGPDSTIVNPQNLSRELSEAVCQQCHLQAATYVTVSGKDQWDYRPGLPLTDFRVDYQHNLGEESMKIVGHVEQMHASECYTQSETLTCVTCHDPHNTPRKEEIVHHYRAICLTCHKDESCGKPHAERVETVNNDCAECHMPKADTNVAHAAFRQHRIGVYGSAGTASKVVAGLSPVLEIEGLDEQERQRCAALAKSRFYRANSGDPGFLEYGLEAAESLIQLKQAGIDGPAVNATLAQLANLQGRSDIAQSLSRQVLSLEAAPTNSRLDATRLLAQAAFQRRDLPTALDLYRKLSTYHRDAYDVYFLGLCENNAGNIDAAIKALEKSLEIDPRQDAAHIALQAIHQSRGNADKAQYHAQEALANKELNQRLQQRVQELAKEKQAAESAR